MINWSETTPSCKSLNFTEKRAQLCGTWRVSQLDLTALFCHHQFYCFRTSKWWQKKAVKMTNILVRSTPYHKFIQQNHVKFIPQKNSQSCKGVIIIWPAAHGTSWYHTIPYHTWKDSSARLEPLWGLTPLNRANSKQNLPQNFLFLVAGLCADSIPSTYRMPVTQTPRVSRRRSANEMMRGKNSWPSW